MHKLCIGRKINLNIRLWMFCQFDKEIHMKKGPNNYIIYYIPPLVVQPFNPIQ